MWDLRMDTMKLWPVTSIIIYQDLSFDLSTIFATSVLGNTMVF